MVEDRIPSPDSNYVARTLLLFGNAGSSFWKQFVNAPENTDCLPHPLNRWSKRIGDQIATELGGQSFYPFTGPPFNPFLDWAKRAEGLQSSKLGMLIHPKYGLWHAYRFALAIPELIELGAGDIHPGDICNQCESQACLDSCPVDAFSVNSYDIETCAQYLFKDTNTLCHSQGCQARLACPVGVSFRYEPGHARFHMSAFVQSMKKQFK